MSRRKYHEKTIEYYVKGIRMLKEKLKENVKVFEFQDLSALRI